MFGAFARNFGATAGTITGGAVGITAAVKLVPLVDVGITKLVKNVGKWIDGKPATKKRGGRNSRRR
jgi:hypothetical protein